MKLFDYLRRQFNKSTDARTRLCRISGALFLAHAVAAQGFPGANAMESAPRVELRWFFDQDPQSTNANIDKNYRVVIVRVVSEPGIIHARNGVVMPVLIE